MTALDTSGWSFDTLAVRAGQERSQFNEHSEALYLTSSFVFENAAQAAAAFAGFGVDVVADDNQHQRTR